jgi:hypothetical protein
MAVEPRVAGAAERTLHFVAHKFTVAVEHDGDGKTEWFDVQTLPVVRTFVEQHPEMFPRGFVALGVPVKAPPRPLSALAIGRIGTVSG